MTMRYHLLGRSGLRVSELCLGTMTFGEDWGWGADAGESRRMFDAYVDAGGNFVDTANIYVGGRSERILGEIITADRRNRIVLATKYTDAIPGENDPNAAGNHRKSMMQAVEASLARLNTDRIDLYYVHSWDFTTRPDEVMRALDDLVRQGKILYAGISDTPAWIVSRCNELADCRGWTPFVANQIEYSLIERTPEREQIPMSRALDLGIVAWAPLAAGLLTGKYTRTDARQGKRRLDTAGSKAPDERALAIARAVDAIADEIGCASSQVALAWVRDQGVIPLVGATAAQQIVANMGYRDIVLSPDHLQRLDAASRIDLGFPHDFLRSASGVIYGGMADRIRRHRDEGLGTD
jgi:aryl-alcohol dehydrogenase-like predicted oxidoreductase